MGFPPLSHLAKVLLIALVLALLGFFVTPASGWNIGAPVQAALLLGIGALLGGGLSALSRTPANGGAAGQGEMTTLFVGNLAFKASEDEVRALFAPFGKVLESRIMRDRKTRRPRGYGFVEMPADAARKAIRGLDGKEFHGRKLRVKEGNRKDEEAGE